MKILRVLPVDKVGGAESMAREETVHELNTGIQDIIYLYSPGKPKILSFSYGFIKLFNTLRAKNYSLIVSSLWPVVPAVLICRFVLWHRQYRWVHFIHSEAFFSMLDLLFTRLAIRFSDGVLCDSPSAARLVVKYRRSQPLKVVRPIMSIGKSIPKKKPSLSNVFNLITWGRINRVKNIDYCVRLVGELVSKGYDARLLVIGPDDDNTLPILKQIAIDLKVINRITFAGPMTRTEICRLATDYNYFVVASSHEGFCIALTEAMRLGLLPLVTLVGGICEYCTDGENCVVIDLLNLTSTAERLTSLTAADRASIVERAMNTFNGSSDYVPNYYNALKQIGY
jgi:glycosyltransferase involved in cell wall biosynthesis